MADDSAEFVAKASHGEGIQKGGWVLHELEFPNGRTVRLETHAHSDEKPYSVANWTAAPTIDLKDFCAAVESAFRRADEQGLELGDLKCIIRTIEGELVSFDFDRDDDAAITVASLEAEGFDASKIDLIRFDSGIAGFTLEPNRRRAGVVFDQSNSPDYPVYGYMLEMLAPEHTDAARQLGGVVLAIAAKPVS